jgi:catechol 2,3-dioxygenase-like lactoylglutathione lyase family enzyme
VILNGLDHVVVVVNDIDEARSRYCSVFGDDAVGEVLEAEGYRRCIVALGGGRLELCQPARVGDGISQQAADAFRATLASRGQGVHNFAVAVDDVPAALEELKDSGVPVIESSFSRSFFVHPKALNGALVQFVEAARDDA